jgi:uncharacterized protein YegJ (DUF2314 family)
VRQATKRSPLDSTFSNASSNRQFKQYGREACIGKDLTTIPRFTFTKQKFYGFCRETMTLGRYKKGDHVKIEVEDKEFGASEWMWMLVEDSDDEQRLVFGELDNEPIANSDVKLGQRLAVSYDKIRDHRRFD